MYPLRVCAGNTTSSRGRAQGGNSDTTGDQSQPNTPAVSTRPATTVTEADTTQKVCKYLMGSIVGDALHPSFVCVLYYPFPSSKVCAILRSQLNSDSLLWPWVSGRCNCCTKLLNRVVCSKPIITFDSDRSTSIIAVEFHTVVITLFV